jgi:hypothetical protein
MRALVLGFFVAIALTVAACSGGSSTSPASPTPTATQPVTGTSGVSVSGTWLGTATDATSTGSTGTALGIWNGPWSGPGTGPGTGSWMGPGMMGGYGPMGSMTWVITQSGNSFTGAVGFGGFQCAARMTMTGTFSDNGGTVTITMPGGSMPMSTNCSGTAPGSFTVAPATGQMHGTYSGTNTCMGSFAGQLTLVRG